MTRTRLRPLQVLVVEDLVLHAGCSTEESGSAGRVRVVSPPDTLLFDQVIRYLESKPTTGAGALRIRDEALATVAVCLRWGSYLGVLADRSKPLWPESGNRSTSLIADQEMMRINIEASAALERWVELWRTDYPRWRWLVGQAVHYLPMETRAVQRNREACLSVLAEEAIRARLVASSGSGELRADVEAHPSRVFANAVINRAWRNGPVEDFHAGRSRFGPPLELCRFSLRQTQSLLRSVLAKVADAMWGLLALRESVATAAWPDLVLPYHLAGFPYMITPSGWTLTESTCPIRLVGTERDAQAPVVNPG